MKRIFLATTMLALAACTNPQTDGVEGIAAASAAFEEAFNAGDAAAVARLYTPDAAVLAPNLERVDGRQAIQDLWQNFFDAGITGLDLTTDELHIDNGSASEVGHLVLQAPDGQGGKTTLRAKYIVLWQLGGDGTWRLYRDIWNNDPDT